MGYTKSLFYNLPDKIQIGNKKLSNTDKIQIRNNKNCPFYLTKFK